VKGKIPSFPYNKNDLRYPLEFYKLRYTQAASGKQEKAITEATKALFSGDAEGFRAAAAKTGVSVDTGDLKPLLR
jgi:hypothetical protein